MNTTDYHELLAASKDKLVLIAFTAKWSGSADRPKPRRGRPVYRSHLPEKPNEEDKGRRHLGYATATGIRVITGLAKMHSGPAYSRPDVKLFGTPLYPGQGLAKSIIVKDKEDRTGKGKALAAGRMRSGPYSSSPGARPKLRGETPYFSRNFREK